MISNGVYSLSDTLGSVMEPLKPMIQINAAVLHQAKSLTGYASRTHMLLHLRTIHMARPTVRMSNDHDILNAKLKNGDKQTTHDTPERVENDASSVLDYLGIAILYPQRRRQ